MSKSPSLWRRLSLEALAIFLGVTAGLLGDDFRDYLNDRDREREALAQLLQDLEIDSLDIHPIRDHSQARAEAMLWLSNAFAGPGPELGRLDEVLDSLARSDLYSYEASNFTYSGLRASGRLDLIRNPSLRRDLVVYFEDRQAAMEETNAGLINADEDFWKALSQYVRFNETESLMRFPSMRIVDLRGLSNDGELLYHIATLGSYGSWQYDLTIQMLQLNRDLAKAVRSYLDSVGGGTS